MPNTVATILVVDDNPDFVDQMRLQLEASGFAVIAAGGEADAETIIAASTFDLAIVDLMMEHHDSGFVVAHRVKRKNPEIPVVLVTAVASETGMAFDAATDEERAWMAADAVLDKPVRFEQLEREIARLLKLGG